MFLLTTPTVEPPSSFSCRLPHHFSSGSRIAHHLRHNTNVYLVHDSRCSTIHDRPVEFTHVLHTNVSEGNSRRHAEWKLKCASEEHHRATCVHVTAAVGGRLWPGPQRTITHVHRNHQLETKNTVCSSHARVFFPVSFDPRTIESNGWAVFFGGC